jgi:hypothetical protein
VTKLEAPGHVPIPFGYSYMDSSHLT